jgi:ssDNA-binding Zn-finger/Zn-ribbon topoisomerase 1
MRCPECEGITGYRRKTKTPEWRCRKCRHEWDLNAHEKARWQNEEFQRFISLSVANTESICLCPNCGAPNRPFTDWMETPKFLCKECEYSWAGSEDHLYQRPDCPECGKRLEIKANVELGVSYRCTGYPECQYVEHRWKILEEFGFPDEIKKREQESEEELDKYIKDLEADKKLPYAQQTMWHPSDERYEKPVREEPKNDKVETLIKYLLGAIVVIFLFYSCFIHDPSPQPYEEKPYDCFGRGCSGD